MSHANHHDCQTLTIPETARILGISRGSAYLAARSGELPGVIRIGRRLLVSRPALERFLAQREDEGGRS